MTLDNGVAAVISKPATCGASESLVQIDRHWRQSLVKWTSLTCTSVILNLFFCEMVTRFIVFLGKPASSQNPQYDLKTLVSETVYAGDDNVILCGDSLMKQGIYPELLSSKLHKINEHIRVVNLATNAGSQKDAICFLDHILSRGIKPRLVVFDYEVAMTGYPTELGNFEWGQAKSYLFNGVLSRPTDFSKSCEIMLSDLSYLIRQRGNLKHFIVDFVSSLAYAKEFQKKTFHQLSDVNDSETSWAGMSPDNRMTSWKDWPQQEWRIHSNYSHSPKSGHFQYNPKMYSVIINYCQKHQIPLMLVWLPHERSIYGAFWYQAPYDSGWFRQRFEEYAREPFVFPLFLNTLPEDFSYYSDYRHLSTYGCVKATELMAEAMSKLQYRNLLIDPRKFGENSHK